MMEIMFRIFAFDEGHATKRASAGGTSRWTRLPR